MGPAVLVYCPKMPKHYYTLHLLILYTATFKNQKNNSPLPMDPATPQPPHVAANPSSFCSSPSPATATATPSSLHCLPSPDTKQPPYPFYSILPKKNSSSANFKMFNLLISYLCLNVHHILLVPTKSQNNLQLFRTLHHNHICQSPRHHIFYK